MVTITYRCGCRECAEHLSVASRCPMHDEPASSAFAASAKALEILYGKQPALPADGLFYPKIMGQSTASME